MIIIKKKKRRKEEEEEGPAETSVFNRLFIVSNEVKKYSILKMFAA